jgi:WD40 repeat protein
VISPDGSAVAVIAQDGLRWRLLSGFEMSPVPGGEAISQTPFWSPDSTSIVFAVFNMLRRVRLPNGAPETIATLPTPMALRGSWSQQGTLVIATGGDDSSLFTVASTGGDTQRLEAPSFPHGQYHWPQFVGSSDEFVFAFQPDGTEQVDMYLATLREGRIENASRLLRNDTAARYTNAGGGRLLFVRNDNLYAQRVNRRSRKVDGDPELLVQGVASAPTANDAHFSVSETGTVVWRPGRAALSYITAFDRQGNVVGRAGPPAPLYWIRVSPDDARAIAGGLSASLVEVGQSGRRSLGDGWRLWTPDGVQLLGVRNQHLVERSVNGSGEVRSIANVGASVLLHDISGDGKHVLYTAGTGGSATIMTVRIDGPESEHVAAQFVGPGEVLGHPRFSPDGRWVVFVASPTFRDSPSGRAIYVQPFPGPGLRKQIAADGTYPVWRADGREIVYLGNDNRIWSIATDLRGVEAKFGAPQPVFAVRRPGNLTATASPLAISRDGSRILFPQDVAQPDENVIHVATGLLK